MVQTNILCIWLLLINWSPSSLGEFLFLNYIILFDNLCLQSNLAILFNSSMFYIYIYIYRRFSHLSLIKTQPKYIYENHQGLKTYRGFHILFKKSKFFSTNSPVFLLCLSEIRISILCENRPIL